jgi:hypothetical protein
MAVAFEPTELRFNPFEKRHVVKTRDNPEIKRTLKIFFIIPPLRFDYRGKARKNQG